MTTSQADLNPGRDRRPDEAARRRPSVEEIIRPQAAHESLSFEEFAQRYNFRLTQDRRRVLTRFVLDEISRRRQVQGGTVRVLDVGCGHGMGMTTDFQWAIRASVDEYWGIDPDKDVRTESGLFDHYECALMETAKIPPASIDVAYSFMVMEHVGDPDGFMAALSRCLKPGGVYLFMTPNRRHYFTRAASTLKRLKLDEFILRIIRRGVVEDYHYPVQYKFNDERTISQVAARTGFDRPQFAYEEAEGPRPYLRGPLSPVFHLLAWKRTVIRNPRSLLTLTCRVARGGGGENAS